MTDCNHGDGWMWAVPMTFTHLMNNPFETGTTIWVCIACEHDRPEILDAARADELFRKLNEDYV